MLATAWLISGGGGAVWAPGIAVPQ